MTHDARKRDTWAATGRAHSLAARLSALRPKVSGGKLDLDQVEALVSQLEALGAPSTTQEGA